MTPFGWLQIVRLGLAQTALGAIVVMTTSTLNRVMVVELALPALIPGLLVALHHVVQLARPRWGFGSDRGGRRTPWIVGGMAVLALGGAGAAVATAVMADNASLGIALGVAAFVAIGVGVGAAGTNILVLLAQNVGDGRRAAAATIVWTMMIAGFVVTGGTAGHFLDPFSLTRLIGVTAAVSGVAFVLAVAATWRLEPAANTSSTSCPSSRASTTSASSAPQESRGYPREGAGMTASFQAALSSVWAEPQARRFTLFVLASMLAYSMQDLILEPFAGLVFGMTPGETTKLAGLQNAGTLTGMVFVALACGLFGEARNGLLKPWIVGGCLASALALGAIAAGGLIGEGFPIRVAAVALGLANGAFATAAIGSMMGLAGQGDPATRGTRMGLWGAAQAVGFGFGGLTGALGADLARGLVGEAATAYALVFAVEALLFLGCARFALRLDGAQADETARRRRPPLSLAGEGWGEGRAGFDAPSSGRRLAPPATFSRRREKGSIAPGFSTPVLPTSSEATP